LGKLFFGELRATDPVMVTGLSMEETAPIRHCEEGASPTRQFHELTEIALLRSQ